MSGGCLPEGFTASGLAHACMLLWIVCVCKVHSDVSIICILHDLVQLCLNVLAMLH
jgi:hypothetical protein